MSEENTSVPLSGTPLGEISQSQPAFEVFLDKHQMKVILLAVVLIIAAIIAVVYRGIEQSAEEEAGRLLVSAAATSELQGLVKNHEGTAAAQSAKVLLAEDQWSDGLKDEAVATLREFLETESAHPALPTAQASLAAKLRAQGQLEESKELFTKVAENPNANHLAAFAWISLGDMAVAESDADSARTAYETVGQDFPGSTYSGEAQKRLLLMAAEKPEAIVAPINVPDVNFTEEENGSGEVESPQLIDMLNSDSVTPGIEVENAIKTEVPSE